MAGCGPARANVLGQGRALDCEGSPCGWSSQVWGEWQEGRWESSPEMGADLF